MFRNHFVRALQVCAALLSISASFAYSWTVSEREFLYDGTGSNDYIGGKSWNSKEIITDNGMIGVNMIGDPDPHAPQACPRVKNCKTGNCWASWLPGVNSERETGLYLSSYDAPTCPDSDWMGFSYFGVVPDAGFAMRSWTGMKPIDRSLSFWYPNTIAPNKHVAGMYAGIRPPWIMKPWSAVCSGGNNCDDQIRVAVVTDHQVASAAVPVHTQLQQATRVVFLQQACDLSLMPCQFELNTKTLCTGLPCGDVLIQASDPAQGGIPFVAGVVEGPGKVAVAPNTRKPIWTSWGSATKTSTFSKTTFQVEISWNQLINTLEAIDISRGGDGSYQSIAAVFGEDWNVKSNWLLIDAGFGQEIYNPALNNRAYVGGNVQRLRVVSVAH